MLCDDSVVSPVIASSPLAVGAATQRRDVTHVMTFQPLPDLFQLAFSIRTERPQIGLKLRWLPIALGRLALILDGINHYTTFFLAN